MQNVCIRVFFTMSKCAIDFVNLADVDAGLNEDAGENSKYWFDVPVFY